MRPWDYIDHELLPHDDGTIYLMARGSEYAIHVNGRELMTNRLHGSEDALADMACDRLEGMLHDARVLVGGLGMGFTLAAVLRRMGPEGLAVVAELMPAVVRWNHELVGKASKYPLRDARASIHLGDVGDLVEKPPHLWTAILLDVDNGPGHLTRPTNGWLYTRQGVQAARDALVPGGILAIWSAAGDPSFTRRLHKEGLEVEVIDYFEHLRPTPDNSGQHVLWMARRPR